MALDHGVRALQVKQWREWVGCGKVRQRATFYDHCLISFPIPALPTNGF